MKLLVKNLFFLGSCQFEYTNVKIQLFYYWLMNLFIKSTYLTGLFDRISLFVYHIDDLNQSLKQVLMHKTLQHLHVLCTYVVAGWFNKISFVHWKHFIAQTEKLIGEHFAISYIASTKFTLVSLDENFLSHMLVFFNFWWI